MFEKFTASAREVVRGAVACADRTGSGTVGEEELLLALLDREGTPAAGALAALGVTARRAAVTEALAQARRRGDPPSEVSADTVALAGLGIDVEEIVSRVEAEHGVGALARPKARGRFGRRPFSREAKSVLERSLRIALGRGEKHIGDEHLLLALTTGTGVATAVLADHGVTRAEVERVLAEPSRAA
ncbi:Clp protease N-terminal domain-containing protein [Streptomyces niger]|uniref:Clp protease N-terminal domain-containing protein n=1 Tax=Streptomyces niger TaxID=66373 RepID=UPI00069C145B|nr:Clp protease N-terminal domain-containing protein [Streptomyces niger]